MVVRKNLARGGDAALDVRSYRAEVLGGGLGVGDSHDGKGRRPDDGDDRQHGPDELVAQTPALPPHAVFRTRQGLTLLLFIERRLQTQPEVPERKSRFPRWVCSRSYFSLAEKFGYRLQGGKVPPFVSGQPGRIVRPRRRNDAPREAWMHDDKRNLRTLGALAGTIAFLRSTDVLADGARLLVDFRILPSSSGRSRARCRAR